MGSYRGEEAGLQGQPLPGPAPGLTRLGGEAGAPLSQALCSDCSLSVDPPCSLPVGALLPFYR